ncbi:xanthine dehydrogenase small subunit [Zhongshania sp.]|uniref:xanthine dehydrogenase small subunit n=1 Tax=Zhongshania sp. TaxID=1971902 RepID=UPI0035637CE9
MIRFLLHDNPHQIDEIAPTMSVLDYLRTSLGQTDCKEGCAAGDCGACTIAIGSLGETGIHYHAANACITPLASLDGRQLLTVAHLREQRQDATAEQDLHPVQAAMVNCHGSQCGFCTPGIVMSLFCWWHAVKRGELTADRHSIETALSGNLCRCTGYQPILKAAVQALAADEEDQFLARESQLFTQLQAQQANSSSCQGPLGHFLLPTSLGELNTLMADNPNAQLIAGATDLGLSFTQQLQSAELLIYTGRVAELQRCEQCEDAIHVGGAVTYSRALPLLRQAFPSFANMIGRLGSLQIRNQGTLAGNIANASPIGDSPPVLIALNARLQLSSCSGNREVAISDFFSGYRQTVMRSDECIVSIVIPTLKNGEILKVYKISKRVEDDISAVCMALWLRCDNAIITEIRLAFGGMAATPARAMLTEQALLNRPFDDLSINDAKQALMLDFSPIDDVRASAAYRLAVAGNLLKRAQLEMSNTANIDLFSLADSGASHHA